MKAIIRNLKITLGKNDVNFLYMETMITLCLASERHVVHGLNINTSMIIYIFFIKAISEGLDN